MVCYDRWIEGNSASFNVLLLMPGYTLCLLPPPPLHFMFVPPPSLPPVCGPSLHSMFAAPPPSPMIQNILYCFPAAIPALEFWEGWTPWRPASVFPVLLGVDLGLFGDPYCQIHTNVKLCDP